MESEGCEEAFDLSLLAFEMEEASSQRVGAAPEAGKGNRVDFPLECSARNIALIRL